MGLKSIRPKWPLRTHHSGLPAAVESKYLLAAWSSGSLRDVPRRRPARQQGQENGSKSLNEQKLASGVSGFPPEIQDGLHGFRDRQIRRIQHPGILRGSERRGRALGIARIRSRISRKRSSRLAEIPFRSTAYAASPPARDHVGHQEYLEGRIGEHHRAHVAPVGHQARRHTESPLAPSSAWRTPGNAATREAKLPTLHGVSRGRRRRLPGRHAARRNAHPASRRPGPPPACPRRPRPGAWRPGPSGRARRCPAHPSPAPWRRGAPRCSFAGGGRPVDGDDRRGNNRICGGNGHESQNKAQAETRPAYTSK